MIPIRDVMPSRTTPFVNYGLIALNILVFAFECTLSDRGAERLFLAWGLVPAHPAWLTATTSMFLHANWLHAGSNLLSLWIFGDNVEDRVGHGRYLVFYLLAGYAAGWTEVWASPASTLPLIGASGAIAGVMGAYLVMFPRSRVLVLIPIIFFVNLVEVPAVIFLGFWFVAQVFGGIGRLADTTGTGGVAFWAHLGGFLTGVVAVPFFRRPERQRVEWWSA